MFRSGCEVTESTLPGHRAASDSARVTHEYGFQNLANRDNNTVQALKLQVVPPENCDLARRNFDVFPRLRNFYRGVQFLHNFFAQLVSVLRRIGYKL